MVRKVNNGHASRSSEAHAAGARVVMAAPQPEKHFSDNATVRALWVNSTVKAVVAAGLSLAERVGRA